MLKIKDQICITQECYTFANWEKALIERCFKDNPSSNQKELAKLLGMSDRNLYRLCKNYGIDTSEKAKVVRFKAMIKELVKTPSSIISQTKRRECKTAVKK